jgi:hypothetical protein
MHNKPLRNSISFHDKRPEESRKGKIMTNLYLYYVGGK